MSMIQVMKISQVQNLWNRVPKKPPAPILVQIWESHRNAPQPWMLTSKQQRLTHSTTKSAGKQCTITCDPVDVELENDDSNLEEEPIPSTRRASQTQTQNCAPIQMNAELEQPVVKGQRSIRSAKSVGKQKADTCDMANIALEDDDSSEEEPAPVSRRTLQTHPSSQTKCKDNSGGEDESDANWAGVFVG